MYWDFCLWYMIALLFLFFSYKPVFSGDFWFSEKMDAQKLTTTTTIIFNGPNLEFNPVYRINVLGILETHFGMYNVVPGCILQFMDRPPRYSYTISRANLRFWREKIKTSAIVALIF